MKKYILVLTIVTSLALEAVPPHFHTDNPRFREYKPSNPYKYYEVEIRPWRSLPKEKVELVLNKFNFPENQITFIESNKDKLNHMLYDVGFNYKLENDKLKITKSGYYGQI